MEKMAVLLVGDQSTEGSERLALLGCASMITRLAIVSDDY